MISEMQKKNAVRFIPIYITSENLFEIGRAVSENLLAQKWEVKIVIVGKKKSNLI